MRTDSVNHELSTVSSQGYDGCALRFVEYSNVRSTVENAASQMVRDGAQLCPLNKYGYDCRCRIWFESGRGKGLANGAKGNPIHVTAPYFFTSGLIATSMTSSLIDSQTSEHVAQVLIDFLPEAIIAALARTTVGQGGNSFAILVTPEKDVYGGDTVVGPGYSVGEGSGTSPAIEDLVLDKDKVGSDNRKLFKANVLDQMKAGTNASTTFTRIGQSGSEESVYISWAPVKATTLRALNSSDFAGGVQHFETLVYIVGIAIPEPALLLPFTAIEGDVKSETDQSTAVLIALIVAACALVGFIASSVAISVTGTVRCLLEIVNRINDGTFSDALPEISGGSLESRKVYEAFERLFLVVRFSNQAFFSGDVHKAYAILADTLELFCNLNNRKAIGIASNNVGNILLQLEREMRAQSKEQSFENLTYQGFSIRERALQRFDEAIQIGEEEYNSAPDDQIGDYAQQV